MKAYLKEDIPDWLHYKNNEFIQQILLVADEGWTIVQRGDKPKYCTSFCELETCECNACSVPLMQGCPKFFFSQCGPAASSYAVLWLKN